MLAFLNKLHHKRHRFKSSTNDLSTSNASNTKANTLGQLSFYLTTRRLKGRNKFSLGINLIYQYSSRAYLRGSGVRISLRNY